MRFTTTAPRAWPAQELFRRTPRPLMSRLALAYGLDRAARSVRGTSRGGPTRACALGVLSPAPASVWLSVGILAPAHKTAVGVNMAGPDAAYATCAQGDMTSQKCICMRECMNMVSAGPDAGAGPPARSSAARVQPAVRLAGCAARDGWPRPVGGTETGRQTTIQTALSVCDALHNYSPKSMAGTGALPAHAATADVAPGVGLRIGQGGPERARNEPWRAGRGARCVVATLGRRRREKRTAQGDVAPALRQAGRQPRRQCQAYALHNHGHESMAGTGALPAHAAIAGVAPGVGLRIGQGGPERARNEPWRAGRGAQ